MPQLNFEWKKTFATNIFTIQPILKYSGSPKSSDFEDKVPNEDSVPQSLSFENIFSNNRFVGYDRQEYGNRITYGFEGEIFNAGDYVTAENGAIKKSTIPTRWIIFEIWGEKYLRIE